MFFSYVNVSYSTVTNTLPVLPKSHLFFHTSTSLADLFPTRNLLTYSDATDDSVTDGSDHTLNVQGKTKAVLRDERKLSLQDSFWCNMLYFTWKHESHSSMPQTAPGSSGHRRGVWVFFCSAAGESIQKEFCFPRHGFSFTHLSFFCLPPPCRAPSAPAARRAGRPGPGSGRGAGLSWGARLWPRDWREMGRRALAVALG